MSKTLSFYTVCPTSLDPFYPNVTKTIGLSLLGHTAYSTYFVVYFCLKIFRSHESAYPMAIQSNLFINTVQYYQKNETVSLSHSLFNNLSLTLSPTISLSSILSISLSICLYLFLSLFSFIISLSLLLSLSLSS